MNNSIHKLNGENFFIESLTYVPLNKQSPLYARPHTLTPDGRVTNLLAERIDEAGSGILTTGLINDISSSILRPSTVAYETMINQGWMMEDRFVFILKVVSHGLGGEVNTYIQGFTNCAEINIAGEHATVAHDLVHHISSVIETTVAAIPTPMGLQRVEKLSKVYDVITDNTVEGIRTQRPVDIIDNIKAQAIANSVSAYGSYVEDPYFQTQVINATNRVNKFSEAPKTSRMDNNISALYLANVINEGVKDYKSKDYTYDSTMDFENTYNDYSSTETILGKNRFLKFLSTVGGYSTARGTFTFNDLLHVDAHGANNFTVGNVMPDTMYQQFQQTPHDGGGEYWHQQDPTTIAAYSMIQSAISLTAKYGFSVAVIHVDNVYTPMIDNFAVTIGPDSYSYLSVGPNDKQILLESLRTRFFHEVFLVESAGGSIPVKADIYVDLIGDSKIYIEYGGGYGTWYTLPTVANNYAVPTISKDIEHLTETTNMFNNFISTVSDVLSNNTGLQQPNHGTVVPIQQPWQHDNIVQPDPLADNMLAGQFRFEN